MTATFEIRFRGDVLLRVENVDLDDRAALDKIGEQVAPLGMKWFEERGLPVPDEMPDDLEVWGQQSTESEWRMTSGETK